MGVLDDGSQPAGDLLAPEDLLQFTTYEAQPLISGNEPDASEAHFRFVDAALADALSPAAAAIKSSREAALEDHAPEVPDDEVTIQVQGRELDLSLEIDDLLHDLVGLYAIGGWPDVRAAVDQLLTVIDVEAARAGAVLTEAGSPSALQTEGAGDQSGYPPTEEDIANAKDNVRRWQHRREAAEAATDVLAGLIVGGLEALERHVGQQALVRANIARNKAAQALAKYQPERIYYESTHFGTSPQPIWRYSFGTSKDDAGDQTVSTSAIELKATVEPLYERVKSLRDAQRQLAQVSIGRNDGDYETIMSEVENLNSQIALHSRMLAEELAQAGRSPHPWAVPLALSVTSANEEQLAGCLYIILNDIINATENLAAGKADSLVGGLRSDKAWPLVVRDGPEHTLVDQIPDALDVFEPLALESLVAAAVQELKDYSGQFTSVVALYYRRALARKVRQQKIIALGVGGIGWLLNIALIIFPAKIPAALEGALVAHGAIEGVRGLLARDAEFKALLTGTLIGQEGLDWMLGLGAVIAERPKDLGLIQTLLDAGIPMSDIASFATRIDRADLQWLDHVTMLESLL